MEIRNEIASNPQVTASLDPYVKRCADAPSWRGGRVELSIFSGSDENPWEEEEELHLEGTLENVKKALTAALEILEILEQDQREQAEEEAEFSVQCSFCGTHHDKRLPQEWGHPDGKGALCVGDDGLLLSDRGVWLRSGTQTWRAEFPFKDLRAGQGFVTSLEEGAQVYWVRRNPFKHFDGHRTQLRVAVYQLRSEG